jgi:LPS-assembly protein
LDRHLRGDAQLAELQNENQTAMQTVRFTTCDEGSDVWYLKAASLYLDHEEGQGVAYNARVELLHVPIFYFPYVSFPIDDRRKSGFLLPSLAVDEKTGTILSTPYYWNIAPHRDATIVPTLISKRGLLLETEFRYLNSSNSGQLDVGFLGSDQLNSSMADRRRRDGP